MTLDQYFHTIVNKPVIKETTMFDKTKMFFTQQIEKINSLLTKPTAFVEQDPALYEEGYWAFEMYTPEWVDEFGDTVKPVHTCFIEPHDGTWIEVLDQILDAMEVHSGCSIKERVYYSVEYPLNEPELAGYTRCLNDEVLQKLLLSYPEVYDFKGYTE